MKAKYTVLLKMDGYPEFVAFTGTEKQAISFAVKSMKDKKGQYWTITIPELLKIENLTY